MRIGNCVQIGIDRTAEYIFLTESDWKLKLHNANDEWQLDPNIFSDISRWNYHGVDANPHSIACAAVQYRYLERLDSSNNSSNDKMDLHMYRLGGINVFCWRIWI